MDKQIISPVEQELDAIRLKNYEKTKDMTTDERVSYLHRKVKDGLRQSGYALVPIDDNGSMRLIRI